MDLIVVLCMIQGEFSVNYQSLSKELKVIDQFVLSVSWLIDNILFNSLMYFLQFDNIFPLCDIWKTSVSSVILYLHFLKLFSSIITELRQYNYLVENQIPEAISHIKNVSKRSPIAEKFLNHITPNIDLTFVNETVKQLIAKIKIKDN